MPFARSIPSVFVALGLSVAGTAWAGPADGLRASAQRAGAAVQSATRRLGDTARRRLPALRPLPSVDAHATMPARAPRGARTRGLERRFANGGFSFRSRTLGPGRPRALLHHSVEGRPSIYTEIAETDSGPSVRVIHNGNGQYPIRHFERYSDGHYEEVQWARLPSTDGRPGDWYKQTRPASIREVFPPRQITPPGAEHPAANPVVETTATMTVQHGANTVEWRQHALGGTDFESTSREEFAPGRVPVSRQYTERRNGVPQYTTRTDGRYGTRRTRHREPTEATR